MATKKQPLYGSIATALEVGISLRQLYYWVEVLQAVVPESHRHGGRMFRRFTAEDVTRLRAIKRLVDEGFTIRAAVRRAGRR